MRMYSLYLGNRSSWSYQFYGDLLQRMVAGNLFYSFNSDLGGLFCFPVLDCLHVCRQSYSQWRLKQVSKTWVYTLDYYRGRETCVLYNFYLGRMLKSHLLYVYIHKHTHKNKHTHTISLFLSVFLFLSHSLTHTWYLSFMHTHTKARMHTRTHTFTQKHARLSHMHPHARTRTHTPSNPPTHTQTHVLMQMHVLMRIKNKQTVWYHLSALGW